MVEVKDKGFCREISMTQAAADTDKLSRGYGSLYAVKMHNIN